MSFKRVDTAGDLMRFNCALRVECTHCFAARTLSAVEVAMIVPENRRLETLKRRLKCSRCGRKQVKLLVLDPP